MSIMNFNTADFNNKAINIFNTNTNTTDNENIYSTDVAIVGDASLFIQKDAEIGKILTCNDSSGGRGLWKKSAILYDELIDKSIITNLQINNNLMLPNSASVNHVLTCSNIDGNTYWAPTQINLNHSANIITNTNNIATNLTSINSLNTSNTTNVADIVAIKSINTTQATNIAINVADIVAIKSINTTQTNNINTNIADITAIKTINTTQFANIATNLTNIAINTNKLTNISYSDTTTTLNGNRLTLNYDRSIGNANPHFRINNTSLTTLNNKTLHIHVGTNSGGFSSIIKSGDVAFLTSTSNLASGAIGFTFAAHDDILTRGLRLDLTQNGTSELYTNKMDFNVPITDFKNNIVQNISNINNVSQIKFNDNSIQTIAYSANKDTLLNNFSTSSNILSLNASITEFKLNQRLNLNDKYVSNCGNLNFHEATTPISQYCQIGLFNKIMTFQQDCDYIGGGIFQFLTKVTSESYKIFEIAHNAVNYNGRLITNCPTITAINSSITNSITSITNSIANVNTTANSKPSYAKCRIVANTSAVYSYDWEQGFIPISFAISITRISAGLIQILLDGNICNNDHFVVHAAGVDDIVWGANRILYATCVSKSSYYSSGNFVGYLVTIKIVRGDAIADDIDIHANGFIDVSIIW